MADGREYNDSTTTENSPSTGAGREIAEFGCNICFELAEDPVITLCGHLHCWPCLYKWLHEDLHEYCPGCKSPVEEEKLIPLYVRRNTTTVNPRSILLQGVEIPHRPPPPPPPQPPRTTPPALNRGFGVSSPVLSVRFHEFSDATGSSYGYNGSFGEDGAVDRESSQPAQGNGENLYKILLFILLFVIFDFFTL